MIWIILIIGLILRSISLNQSLWLDEAINVLAVKNYSLVDLITQYAKADFHPPGYFLILWFWTKLFGYKEIAVRIPSVIFGVLSIYFIYLIDKKLMSKKLGLLAAVLLAINPLHIYYSQEARMYSLATLAVLINILLLIKLIRQEKINLPLFVMSNILVLSSDYIAYFIFPAQLIFLLNLKRKEAIKKWVTALAAAILVGIWWFPIFLNQLNVGSIASANLPAWKFVVGDFNFKTVPLTFVKFIIGRISLADKLIYGVIILPVCSLFAFLIFKGAKFADDLSRKLLFSWIAIPILLATIISTMVPIYNYFRVLFILPGFIILVSLGILSFKGRFQKIFFISVFLIELFCTLVYLFNPLFHREDWRGVVDYLKSIDKNSQILFESSGTMPPFDYYSKNNFNAKGALKDFPAKDESAVSNLDNLLKDNKEIYLVDYLVQITDPNRLVAKKLDQLGYKQIDIKNFTGVGFVYHYVK